MFPLLITARVLSVAGDWLYQIALIWLILEITGSSSAVSVVAVAQILPLIGMSFILGGRLGSSLKLAGLAIVDIAQAVVVMLLPALYWLGRLNVAGFVVIGVLIALLDSISDPGLQAVVPRVFDRVHIATVHSLLDLTKRLGRIAGPGLVSVLLLVIPTVSLFTIDAGSFLVSAALLLVMARIVGRARRDSPPSEPVAEDEVTNSLKHTFTYLRANPILLWLFTLRNSQNLLWAIYLIGTPVLVQRVYHAGPGLWSAFIVVYALGQVVGNFVTTRRRGYRAVTGYVVGGWVLTGAGFAGLGAVVMPWAGALFLFVAGVGSAAANVSSDSYVGLAVPVPLQPAAFSWQFSGNQVTQLAGVAAFGVLLDVLAVRHVIIGVGVAMVAVALLGGVVCRARSITPAALDNFSNDGAEYPDDKTGRSNPMATPTSQGGDA